MQTFMRVAFLGIGKCTYCTRSESLPPRAPCWHIEINIALVCRVMSCHVTSCPVMAWHGMAWHVVLCCVVLCCVMLCYVMSCHVMLCLLVCIIVIFTEQLLKICPRTIPRLFIILCSPPETTNSRVNYYLYLIIQD